MHSMCTIGPVCMHKRLFAMPTQCIASWKKEKKIDPAKSRGTRLAPLALVEFFKCRPIATTSPSIWQKQVRQCSLKKTIIVCMDQEEGFLHGTVTYIGADLFVHNCSTIMQIPYKVLRNRILTKLFWLWFTAHDINTSCDSKEVLCILYQPRETERNTETSRVGRFVSFSEDRSNDLSIWSKNIHCVVPYWKPLAGSGRLQTRFKIRMGQW